MANQSAKVFNIDLKSELLTTLNKNDIKQFTGFNQRNSPILNDGLKHFMKNTSASIIDQQGRKYELKNDGLYQDNIKIKNIASNLPFVKVDNFTLTNEGRNNVIYTIPYETNNRVFKCIQTSSVLYIYEKINDVYVLFGSYNHYYNFLSDKDCGLFFNITDNLIHIVIFYNGNIFSETFTASSNISDKGLNFAIWKDSDDNTPYLIFRTIPENNVLFDIDFTDSSFVNYYSLNVSNGTNAVTHSNGIGATLFFEKDNYYVSATINKDYYAYFSNRDNVLTLEGRNRLNQQNRLLASLRNGTIMGGTYDEQYKYLQFPVAAYANIRVTQVNTSVYNVTIPFVSIDYNISNGKALINDNFVKLNISFEAQCCTFTYSKKNIISYDPQSDFSNPDKLNQIIQDGTFTKPPKGDLFYFSNYYTGNDGWIIGGGCTTGVNGDASFSESFTVDMVGDFKLVYNNNYFANYSWCGKIIENWLSIYDDFSKPILCGNFLFYQKNKKWYKVYEQDNIGYISFIFNRYILLCTKLETGDVLNLYDTQTDTWYDYACDWDNRFLIGSKTNLYYGTILNDTNYNSGSFKCEEGTGENVQNTTDAATSVICSSVWGAQIYTGILPLNWNVFDYSDEELISMVILGINENYPHMEEVYMSTNLNSTDLPSAPVFLYMWDNENRYYPQSLQDKIYPVGDIIFNTSLKTDFIQTSFNLNYVYQDEVYYQLLTRNSEIIFAYAKGTELNDIDYLFCLQGNTYVIQNNIINSCTVQDNIVSNVTALISCEGLKYLGATLDVAYFYSEANKNILVFTGNRKLEILTEFNGITSVYKSGYSVPFSTFFILTNLGLICISDKGYIYVLNEDNYTDFMLYTTGINLLSNSWAFYSIYNEGDRVKIKAETSFYGFGNNQVTIIDTWYIRLYADEAFNGSIKFKVTSLTNKGTESEETEFLITADMFDKVTNSYYLRYQPKLQRGVGLSLSIESDYDIIELSCSAIPDTTVQLSKPFSKQNVINGGKI